VEGTTERVGGGGGKDAGCRMQDAWVGTRRGRKRWSHSYMTNMTWLKVGQASISNGEYNMHSKEEPGRPLGGAAAALEVPLDNATSWNTGPLTTPPLDH